MNEAETYWTDGEHESYPGDLSRGSLLGEVDLVRRSILTGRSNHEIPMGAPDSVDQLQQMVDEAVTQLHDEAPRTPISFALRISCTSDENSRVLVVYQKGSTQYHIHLDYVAEEIEMDELIEHLEAQYDTTVKRVDSEQEQM